MKDIFGNQEFKPGAKIPTNNEWNELNNSLTGMQIGDNLFDDPLATASGIKIPSDTFHNPHVAYVYDGNYTDAIIGPDREKDWYPFVDSLSVPYQELAYTFQREHGSTYYRFDDLDNKLSYKSVRFPEKNTIQPEKPTDNNQGAIVGYQWDIVPEIKEVRFSEDANFEYLQVFVDFEPNDVFDVNDIQTSIYSKDSSTDAEIWAPSTDTGTERILQTLLDDYLSPEEVDISDNIKLFDSIMIVPVARYDWDKDQAQLNRVIQLLFGTAVPGGAQYLTPSPETASVDHPFKARVKVDEEGVPTSVIEVGYLRPSWKDSFTIDDDPETDKETAIEYDTVEEITLDTEAPHKSYYVYYRLYKFDPKWLSYLEKSEVWPPVGDPVNVGNIIVQVGYAAWNSESERYNWYQHLRSCPTLTPASIRGEFEAWYEEDGNVTISKGAVSTFNNDTAEVAEATYPLNASIHIWVEILSAPSAGTPDVTIQTTLVTGASFPGKFQNTDPKKFNFKIGEISDGIYTPHHTGRLDIDNTLLMPLIEDEYTAAENQPRMLEVHDDQETEVGDDSNDKLLDLKRLNVEIRGGGVRKMYEDTKIEFYGQTKDESEVELVETTGVDGDDFEEGSITFTPKNYTYKYDHGLQQDVLLEDISPSTIEAGDKIRIEFAGKTATINAPIYEGLQWLDIQNDTQIVHLESPVTSESDSNHWTKCKWDLTAGTISIDDGAPQTEVTLYWDKANHMWKIDSDTSGGPSGNWLYRHCSGDYATYPDLILAAMAGNAVILVDDECYAFREQTQVDPTNPAPTVTNTYANCEACEATLVNEQWKVCGLGTNAAVLSAAHTLVDFAWLCIGAEWVKCFFDAMTAVVETDPTVLEQCGLAGAPAQCSDLVGWPCSDSFSGTACDSGAVDDTNWDMRWTQSVSGSLAVGGGKCTLNASGGPEHITRITNLIGSLAHTGDFTFEIDVDLDQIDDTDPDAVSRAEFYYTSPSVNFLGAGWEGNNSSYSIRYRVAGGSSTSILTSSFTSVKLKMVRVSGNVSLYYDIGAGYVQAGSTQSDSGAIGNVLIQSQSYKTTNATIVSVKDASFVDGSSGEFYIDPTGEACV
jgi:hypothetical protein